jgi:hypothetical protein
VDYPIPKYDPINYNNPYTEYGRIQLGHSIVSDSGVVWLNNGKCGNCGANVDYRDRNQHENFHKTFSNRKDDTMSNVLWCDYGDHAFKRGTPGSASFDATSVDDNGQNVNATMDACPTHNPLRVKPDYIAKELEQEYPVHNID